MPSMSDGNQSTRGDEVNFKLLKKFMSIVFVKLSSQFSSINNPRFRFKSLRPIQTTITKTVIRNSRDLLRVCGTCERCLQRNDCGVCMYGKVKMFSKTSIDCTRLS